MAKFIAYTQNADNSINVLAGSDRQEVFAKILPAGTVYEIHEGEVYAAGGKKWLSQDEQGYIDAKKQDEKNAALSELNEEYTAEKANLCEAYTSASMAGDTETAQAIATDMQDLNSWYDEEYRKIEEA